jgi:hypothetical protein
MGLLVANTNSYAQQQLLGPVKQWQCSWQPVTALDLHLWLTLLILMGLIGVCPERYWMENGVSLPKDELPPAAYLRKTCFRRSTASFIYHHTIHELKLLKPYHVRIQREIFYWSSSAFILQQNLVPSTWQQR